MAVAQTRQRGGTRREQACDTSTSVTASGKAQLRHPAPKLQSLVPRAGSVSHGSVPEASYFCAQCSASTRAGAPGEPFSRPAAGLHGGAAAEDVHHLGCRRPKSASRRLLATQ